MKFINKILDIIQFREGYNEDEEGDRVPKVTTGSIVWGMLFRSFIIIFLSFFVFDQIEFQKYWWIPFLVLWFFVAYPGYRQYQRYSKKIEIIQEETLCGSCRHFDSTSQLCKIYDEHITKDYIPCDGDNWEPN